ncbi:hypothetical protein LB505_011450 [Fusarium chuoi]|nr:hypothetical protein LB505_011450 [Fusarium chuoi]
MFIIDDLLDQYSIVEQFDYNKLQALLNDCADYVERSLGVSSHEVEPSTRYLDHDAVLSFEEYASTHTKRKLSIEEMPISLLLKSILATGMHLPV